MLKTVKRIRIPYTLSKAFYYFLWQSVLAVALLAPIRSQNVLTQRNDLQRTGWNSNESVLTQANVSGGSFGKIFTRTVDDQIYCQPLIVNDVTIAGVQHNILIVATV